MRVPVAWYVNGSTTSLKWLEESAVKVVTGAHSYGEAIDKHVPLNIGSEFDVIMFDNSSSIPTKVVPYTRSPAPANGTNLFGEAMYNVTGANGSPLETTAAFIVLRVDDETLLEAAIWSAVKTLMWRLP